MTPESEWIKYLGMARHIAKCLASRGVSYQDLYNEAESYLAVLVCDPAQREQHDPTKSSLCTWLHIKLRYHLLSYIRKASTPGKHNWKKPQHLGALTARSITAKPNKLQALLTSLGDEAREVVYLILGAPEEIAEELCPKNAGRIMSWLRGHLATNEGWDEQHIDRVVAEVRDGFES